ncbi:MAG: exonuclease domain-containing protein [Promethearchaeota archaeon]
MGFTVFMALFFGVLIIVFVINKASMNARGNADIVLENDLTLFLKGCNGQIIVFDVETNGLNTEKDSVLSCSALKYSLSSDYTMTEIDRFERYYYPIESFHRKATDINGLTRKRIGELRKDVSYAQHFNEDYDLVEFCSSANSYVAHNLSFDQAFIKTFSLLNSNTFCTMKSNASIVKVRWMESKGEWKWPSLSETARYYLIKFSHKAAHGSTYDAEITAQILQKMIFNLKGTPTQQEETANIELTLPTEQL